jgi:hypothetical protein
MNSAQPGLDERDEPHRIMATTQLLAGSLKKAAMRRAHDRGTRFGEVVEGALMQFDDLGLPTRPLPSGSWCKSKTVKQGEHTSAKTFDSFSGRTCVVDELLSSTTARRHGALWPILSLLE